MTDGPTEGKKDGVVCVGVENSSFNREETTVVPANDANVAKVNIITESKKLEVQLNHFLPDELSREKCRVWKSLICLCFALTMGFSSSITLVNSITSILPNDNLGISALAVAGASQVVAAAVLVPVANKLWGSRTMLRVSLIVNLLFIASFLYATWATTILGAICFGVGQSLLVSNSFIYANTAGYWYERLVTSGNVDAILVRVSGMVNCALGSAFVWGNLALYLILGSKPTDESETFQDVCGAAYCNQELNISTLDPPPPSQYYTLVGLLSFMGLLGCGLIFATEDFAHKLGHFCCTKDEALVVLRNSWRLLQNPRGFLLVPITVMIGMEESCLVGDITKALISCSLGISMVGLVMLAYGLVEIPVSLGHWLVVKKYGRVPVVAFACFTLLIPIITMLLWTTDPNQLEIYYILICLWAIADSLLMSVIFSTYAALFEDNMEGAFSTMLETQESGAEIQSGIDNPAFQSKDNTTDNFVKENVVQSTVDELNVEKRRIWKSLACLCLTVTLSFSSSIALINSITSLYSDGNLGISVLAVISGSQLFTSVFVSVWLKLWGCLKMLRIGLLTNSLFVIAFFYPNWFTLISGALVFGFTASMLFTAGFMYVNSAGYWLARITDENNLDAILVRVSGIMNASLGSGFIWGNVALYLILGPPPEVDVNSAQDLCGAAYCNKELNVTTLQPPSPNSYYTLIGILTAMSVVACAISYFLEDFSSRLGHKCCTMREICTVFRNTWRVFKNPNMFLLAPLTVVIAMEEAFMVGDITKALISCSLGISMVGLIMMAFGVSELVASLVHWPIVQKLGRPFAVGMAVFIFIVEIVTLLLWKPNPHYLPVYFVLVCLWAAADAILISVTFATYGVFFEDNMEGGFAAANVWLSLGNV
uniref:Uncharacterized protein n=1 Tax=Strigamia maritima TaxID=126957 RepID=T1J285_STRMM